MDDRGCPNQESPRRAAVLGIALVLVVIAAGQFFLYGSSLLGKTVLLPLDLLTQPGRYLPSQSAYDNVVAHSIVRGDLISAYEVHRRFAASELRAGRLPLWNPYNYAGAPMARWGLFSPFNLLQLAFPQPIGLAWIQLVQAVLAGLGAYLFFRRAMALGFLAASCGAIAYPVTGFFVLWQGFPLTSVVSWLPWILLATDRTVRRPAGWGSIWPAWR